jgi:lipid A 3-O-deacylase
MGKRLFLILCILMEIQAYKVFAQALNNTGIERSVNTDRYCRINYSNDYFTATDFYLTQAIQLEFVLPALSHVPVYNILYHPQNNETKYGLSLEHDAYTPMHYQRYEIQQGDRPFAACFFLNSFAISTNTAQKQRVSTTLSLGVIGPAAFGNAMQTYIHEQTNNALPLGWHNQIRNDVVLNYEVDYQKQLFALPDIFTLTADAQARIGTLNTKANAGFTLMAGYFHNPFASLSIKGRKIQFYGYDHPEINIVGYDATLEGGLFNRSSPYTISAADVSRLVFRNNWGLVMQIGKLYLEYYQSYMTKEFRTGMEHHNGGIQMGYAF